MKTYTRKVNYYETDKMGVVHHSNYIRYFEEARTDFMDQIGCPYHMLEAENLISPVVSVECKYKQSLRFGDTFEVRTSLAKINKVVFAFSYEIYDSSTNELKAYGTSEHCMINDKGEITSMYKKRPDLYQLFVDEFEAQKNEQ